jgi:hypothetical protein
VAARAEALAVINIVPQVFSCANWHLVIGMGLTFFYANDATRLAFPQPNAIACDACCNNHAVQRLAYCRHVLGEMLVYVLASVPKQQ